jgi:hypothetical protein
MPTTAEHRLAYDTYIAYVHDLCTNPGIRTILSKGRGRPVEECAPLDRFLTRSTAGRPARRAYYTTASLIALAGPQAHTIGVRPATEDPASTISAGLVPDDIAQPRTSTVTATGPATTQAGDVAAAWYRRPNLGATLASAVRRAGYNEERTDDHLHVLTRLGDDQLHRRLPSHVARLLGDGLTPDWAVLLSDLIQRTFDPAPVGLRWRDAFYLTLKGPHQMRAVNEPLPT